MPEDYIERADRRAGKITVILPRHPAADHRIYEYLHYPVPDRIVEGIRSFWIMTGGGPGSALHTWEYSCKVGLCKNSDLASGSAVTITIVAVSTRLPYCLTGLQTERRGEACGTIFKNDL